MKTGYIHKDGVWTFVWIKAVSPDKKSYLVFDVEEGLDYDGDKYLFKVFAEDILLE